MKIGYHIGNPGIQEDSRFVELLAALSAAGVENYPIKCVRCLRGETDMVLSLGGDGTFLNTARLVSEQGLPILGVNFGRLGFLSENSPENVVEPLLKGEFTIEERTMLKVGGDVPDGADFWPYALNEVSLHRRYAEMLGIDASIGRMQVPTYWADGLLVATASGSTAYNLSAGGPICTPESPVLLLTPIAPHNLGLRPLVLPETSEIRLRAKSRKDKVALTLDNRTYEIPSGSQVSVSLAPFRLRRVNFGRHSFIDALRSRFFWGQDVRNIPEYNG